MKKYLGYLFVVLFLLIPSIMVKAETTDRFYMDIQIEEDGSIFVRELASLAGSYNGRLRDIVYKNLGIPHFTGKESDFAGSDLYNGSSISDIKVYDIIDNGNLNFDSMEHLNKEYSQVNDADTGDYGVYTMKGYNGSVDFKIFNPSKTNTAFYMEYRIHDVVAVHNDVAELAWNILGDTSQEDINVLRVRVHLPKEDASMRAWLHGPLYGYIDRTSDEYVEIRFDQLEAYKAVSVRVMFDKSLVPKATKTSGIDGKQYILAYEQEQADLANEERERLYQQLLSKATYYLNYADNTLELDYYNRALQFIYQLKDSDEKTALLARAQEIRNKIEVELVEDAKDALRYAKERPKRENYNQAKDAVALLLEGSTKDQLVNELAEILTIVERKEFEQKVLWGSILGVWFLVFIGSYCYLEYRYKKKYQSHFKDQYYREFPGEYTLGATDYLLHHKVTQNAFSATLLDLIRQHIITMEEVEESGKRKKKKDYVFVLSESFEPVRSSEQQVIKLLFEIVGKDRQVTLKQLKNYGSTESRARTFMREYKWFLSSARTEGIQEDFYLKNDSNKVLPVLLLGAGFLLWLFAIPANVPVLSTILFPVFLVIILIFVLTRHRRNQYGNLQYDEWMGHKRFLLDFGRFDEKELPEIALWERYMVSATILGIADKVQKSMKIQIERIEALATTTDNTSILWDLHTIHMMNHLLNTNITDVVASTVSRAVSNSSSTIAAANSSSSSGGGFGGGSSGGGGSFGGGGGTGRF